MPDLGAITNDPDFLGLDAGEKAKVLQKVDPDFAAADPKTRDEVVSHFTAHAVGHAANSVGLDPHFAIGIAHAESGFDESAKSPKGAEGVMQVMPLTGADVRKKMASGALPTPEGAPQNIQEGVAYLHELKQGYSDLPEAQQHAFTAAAYNAGPGAVHTAQQKAKAAGGDPNDINAVLPFLPKETQDYVPRVLGNRDTVKHGRAPQATDGTYLGTITAGQGQRGGADEQAGAPAAPSPAPGPGDFVPPAEQTRNALDVAKRTAQAAVYDGLVFPANELNRLGYSLDIPGFTPPTDHIEQLKQSALGSLVGQENISHLNADTPAGFWGRVGAAASVIEPAYLPTFGMYVAARAWGSDEATARLMEAGAGGLATIHEGTKILANRSAAKAIASLKADLAAKIATLSGSAGEQVAKAQADVQAAHSALLSAQATEDARVAGLNDVVDQHNKQQAAAVAQGKAAKAALDSHVAGAQDLTEFGQSLQEPGRAGIVGAAADRLRKNVGNAYDAWKAAGEKAGIELPTESAHRPPLAETAQEIVQLARTEGATPAERALAQKISDILTPTQPTGPAGGTREAIQRALEEGRLGPQARPSGNAPSIPIGTLIDLKSEVGKTGLSPQEFPVLRSRYGRLLFGKLGAQLDGALRSLSVGHPDVEAASQTARQLAKDQFRFRKTAKVLLRAETPEVAGEALFSPRYSTRLLRLMKEASPSEVVAMQKAHLNDIYLTGADANMTPDFTAASKAWTKVPSNARRLVAARGYDPAQTALLGMLESRKVNLNAPELLEAENRTTNLLRDLSAAQKAAEEAPAQVVLAGKSAEIKAAERGLAGAQKNLSRAESIIPRAQAAGAAKVAEFRRVGGKVRMGGLAGMVGKRAIIMLSFAPFLGGATPKTVAESLAWIHVMMLYPKYVRAAIRTPLNTEHGLKMAQALAGLLNGYYGLQHAKDKPAASAPSPAAAPAPPAGQAPPR